MITEEIITRVIKERERQFNLPGLESDVRNSPNDWATIISSYVLENVRRGPVKPTRDSFEDSLIKAAAVILAALEHCDKMQTGNHFAN